MTSDWKRKEQRYTLHEDGKQKQEQKLNLLDDSELTSEMEAPDLILCGHELSSRRVYSLKCKHATAHGPEKEFRLRPDKHEEEPGVPRLLGSSWALWPTWSPSVRPTTLAEHLEKCRASPLTFRPANSCLLTSQR